MDERNIISIIIPAFNEEQSIGKVIGDIPHDLVNHVIVVNNASTDKTVEEAEKPVRLFSQKIERATVGLAKKELSILVH